MSNKAEKKYEYNVEVSEELKQGGFDFNIGDNYHYIKIGATNVGQLQKAKILSSKYSYTGLRQNKPDGLILHGKNTVIALVEYKPYGKILSENDALEVLTDWYFELASRISCKVVCASDGENTYWFYASNRELIKESTSNPLRVALNVSDITEHKISQSKIVELIEIFNKFDLLDDEAILRSETILNPQALANSVWQKIWISTGKEPEKCLYNVVEIFIFKFLSDLEILSDDYGFQYIYNKSLKSKDDALSLYANYVRPKIREMFPKSLTDNTTVINGTIFVNEAGKANLAQSTLFKTVLQEFANYDKQYGSFKNIDKNFKTRLYESFLRQSAGISALGQYFTPRNVTKAIIKMVDIDNIPEDAFIGDPFCGVGGFILELLNEAPQLKKQFEPKNGIIQPKLTLLGYDKGSDEKEDERTIILAKANMLIYLSDMLVKYKEDTKQFSENVFNNVFHLIKTNLGTLGIKKHKNQFNLILTNPPYVTSGVSTIKKEIDNEGLKEIYPSWGNGLEGLALEWIIYSLKEGGKAFVVLPDGLMSRDGDKKLRNKVLESCEVNAIISLPSRTFFATPKKTYIVSLTKKFNSNKVIQAKPVFTYLVSEIGETRDSKRFEQPESNDLNEMVKLYRQFMASPNDFETTSQRCKIQNVSRLIQDNWLVDRDWSDDEKRDLGIHEDISESTESEFYNTLREIGNYFTKASETEIQENIPIKYCTKELHELGKFSKGNSKYTQKYCYENKGEYPVYSANTKGDYTIGCIKTYDYECECLRITTNGVYAGTVTYLPFQRFSINGDAGIFIISEENIDYRYLEYALRSIRNDYGYGWENKPTNNDIENISIQIPIKDDGSFDLEMQKEIASKYKEIEVRKKKALEILKDISSTQIKITE